MSDRARFERLDSLFAEALELPAGARRAFLDQACAGDEELRERVERLLAADAGAGRFMVEPAFVPPDLAPPRPEPPILRLGPYRLLREIGSGGMGTVYLAQRDDAEYERRVAVKILRAEIESEESIHRFFAERQILARLEHVGIARLYDGGSTDDGRPFLVMELVEGLPLDEYCDRHQLSVNARVDLFRRICAAVQYAHQNLLVHRELKPANILVTEGGEPKLLDFGIAKELGPGAERQLTQTGTRLLTPSYASPEQILRRPITTASDVYSLGVVLYELLTSRSPYRVASRLPHEIEGAICDQEAERPSQSLSRRAAGEPTPEETARARGTRVAALRRKLQGDLDTILLTALRKEPARRYGSAAELAADLESYRQHLPVAARPDTLLYRTRKLLRRRRGAVAAAAVAALTAFGFLVGLVAQGRRLARERDKARHALSFLVDTFRTADPYRTQGEHLTAREILVQGAARVSRELAGQPDVQAALMDAIGQVSVGLGRADSAEPLLANALQLRRRSRDTSPLDLAASLEHLAKARYERSEFESAEALLREAVGLRRRTASDRLALARDLNDLGMAMAIREPTKEVEALHREALGLAHAEEGAEGPTVAESLIQLGRLARDQGDYARAERLYREGLTVQRKVLPAKDPQAIQDQGGFAVLLLDAGKPKEAELLVRDNLKLQREIFGAGHPSLAIPLSALGLALHNQGDYAGAETAFREALALPRAAGADADLPRALALGNLANVLQAQDRIDESVPLLEEALQLRRRSLGPGHPLVGQVLLHLARAERLRGRPKQGLEGARQALAIVEQAEGKDHPHVAYPLREIGADLMASDDPAGAEPYLRRALEVRRRGLPAGHPDLAQAQISLALCLFRLGRNAEAETLHRAGRATLVTAFGAESGRVKEADEQLAKLRRERAPAP